MENCNSQLQEFSIHFNFPGFSGHSHFPDFSSVVPQFPSVDKPPLCHIQGWKKSWKIPNFAQFSFPRQAPQRFLSHRALPGPPGFSAPERFPEKMLLPAALPWKTLLRGGRRRENGKFGRGNGNFGGEMGNLGANRNLGRGNGNFRGEKWEFF